MCDERRRESSSWTFEKTVSAFLRNRVPVIPGPPPPGFGAVQPVAGAPRDRRGQDRANAPWWAARLPGLCLAGMSVREGQEHLTRQHYLWWSLSPDPRCVLSALLPSRHLERPYGLAVLRWAHTFGQLTTAFGASLPCRGTLSHAVFLSTVLLSKMHFGDIWILLFKYLYAVLSRMHAHERFGPGKCKLFALFIEQ